MRVKLSLASLFLIFTQLILTNAHAIGPKVIYGVDDRLDYYQVRDQQVLRSADSTVALLRAASLEDQGELTKIISVPYGAGMGLCANEPFFAQETAAFCSGFLVSPDTVVTAGHCIGDQASCDVTRFVFGFKLSGADGQPHTVPSGDVFACKSVVHSVSLPKGEDFAVVKLDRPVTQVAPLAYRSSGKIGVGDALRVIGYPAGLPMKIAGGANVRSLQPEFLVANLDTYGGNSGSAVFNAVTGEVEGILVRGEMDYVYQNGCRSSKVCAADACRGEDVTLFERVLPYIK